MLNQVIMSRPQAIEYDAYYQTYLDLVTEDDLLLAMEQQVPEFEMALAIDDDQAAVVHSPYGWTIKQVVGHMIDNERVFGYRAMRFAAGDSTDLPGYEQDDYVAAYDYQSPNLGELVAELKNVRLANLSLFRRIDPQHWDRAGTADGRSISVRAIACLQVAHLRHHLNIIKSRLSQQ